MSKGGNGKKNCGRGRPRSVFCRTEMVLAPKITLKKLGIRRRSSEVRLRVGVKQKLSQ